MATATDELMINALSLLQNKVTQCAQMIQKKNEVLMWKGAVIAQPDKPQKDSMDQAVKDLLADIQVIAENLALTATDPGAGVLEGGADGV